jgi:VWFA-related protein
MRSRLGVSCGLLFAAGFAAGLLGQPRSGASIQVTLVEVPVNVYDRAGNAVRGLKAGDFELADDGKRQSITNFEEIDLAKIAEVKATLPPAARRNFMLLFDLSNSTPASITRSREAAMDFVTHELLPSDAGAVATYTVESGFRLLTNFTGDRDTLVAAIATMGDPRFFKPADPLMLAARDYGEMKQEPGMVVRVPKAGAVEAKTAEYLEVVAASNAMTGQVDNDYKRGRISHQVNTFANIGRMLDSVSGRKQVILLSEGFDAELIQGRERRGRSKETQDDSDIDSEKVVRGASYEVNSDDRFGNASVASSVTTMGELLRRSDVVLHAIDIKGLRTDVDASAGLKRSSNEGLYLLTRPTGGEVFKNANDLSSSFRSLLKQQEVVYILGFQASGSIPGRFHNLTVKVKTPGATASYRSGYYELKSAESTLEATLATGEILLNDVASEDVKTNVFTAAFPVEGEDPQVPVIVEIDGRSLLAGAKNGTVKGDLFIYAFDGENRVRDFLFQRVALDLAKVGATLEKSGLKYYGALSLPPGDYAIKTLVRLPEMKLDGFRRVDISVPDFSQPLVVQVATEQPGAWLVVSGGKQGRNYDYPFTVESERFVPAGTWDASQRLALFAYNVDPKSLDLTGTVRTSDGATRNVDLAVVRMTGDRLLLEVKPGGLAAGRYALDLSVRPKSGGWSKSFAIPLIVR